MKIRKICGFPDYAVSKDGRIWSSRQKRTHGVCSNLGTLWFLLSPKMDKGYCRVTLHNDAGHKTKRVHRLVWEAFVGPIPRNKVVDHKDFDRSNNSLSNLQLITQLENVERSNREGRLSYGDKNGKAKLTWSQVKCMRKLYATGRITQTELAIRFNVTAPNVCNIVNNKAWTRS